MTLTMTIVFWVSFLVLVLALIALFRAIRREDEPGLIVSFVLVIIFLVITLAIAGEEWSDAVKEREAGMWREEAEWLKNASLEEIEAQLEYARFAVGKDGSCMQLVPLPSGRVAVSVVRDDACPGRARAVNSNNDR